MSYSQAMRWGRKHPKGTRQPVLMSTGSGFWPAISWLQGCYLPYTDACKDAGVLPLSAEAFYRATTGRQHFQRMPSDYAAMTIAGTLQ